MFGGLASAAPPSLGSARCSAAVVPGDRPVRRCAAADEQPSLLARLDLANHGGDGGDAPCAPFTEPDIPDPVALFRHLVDSGRFHRAPAWAGSSTPDRSRSLMAALQRTGLVPMWAKESLVVLQPLTLNRLVDSAMMTNLGSLEAPPSFGAGAGGTLGVWLSAPSRAPLGVCIGAVTVDGRLHLAVRYPHRLFGPEAARRFAESYLNQVVRVAASRP